MKEVLAIIRMNMMNKTKQALSDAGISSFTARECVGRGKGIVDYSILKGAEKGYDEAISQLGMSHPLVPKRWLSIVVPDKLVSKTVETIIKTNQMGKAGDGKIFILPVMEAYRIRTAEQGDQVLDEA
ncbi:MAG TPA: P-II family nitrogen regulator [Termitinemataceae bacterium]|nr:P-II family nitrogen regulator [Termitinemataceae bacterium]HOM22877.1 P-II family nitrogen regulator [Termitinemataceae bacterium]HPP99818.1 P-II family nitrogen regulator [Termitinemataceae bacterium]